MFEKFEKNNNGRDWVVGDIHGCFLKLEEELKAAGFNEKTDRLFSVGDLVDRGPDSEMALHYLKQPWFHAIRGNHEQMALEWDHGNFMSAATYAANGGGWFLALSPEQQFTYQAAFARLPIAMEIEAATGRIGIVHADCPYPTWQRFVDELEEPADSTVNIALWDRTRISNKFEDIVPDIDLIIVGHTPLKEIAALGNVLFIDTGAVFGGKLTLLPLDSIEISAIK